MTWFLVDRHFASIQARYIGTHTHARYSYIYRNIYYDAPSMLSSHSVTYLHSQYKTIIYDFGVRNEML